MTALNQNRIMWLACLLIATATLALYLPVRHYDFVQYDDNEYVFDNPEVKAGLSWWGLVWTFVDAHASNWHPLTWLSHMLDCQLFGLNPGPPHLVNAAFHCLNAVLLFLLLRYMTGASGRSLFAAALFAVHPLRVESVAWISERKDVLSGFFFMVTLLTYARFSKLSNNDRRKAGNQGVSPRKVFRCSLIAFALGLLSKPMLITTPFVLILMDYWPLKRIRNPEAILNAESKATGFGMQEAVKEKWQFFILAAISGLITIWAQGKAVVSIRSMPVHARIESMFANYLGYLREVFWPHNLNVLNLRTQSESVGYAALSLVILTTITFLTVSKIKCQTYLLTGWLWFLIMLSPVIGLIQTGLQSIADRYTYLPSIGLSIIAAWGGWDCLSKLRDSRIRNGIAFGLATLTVCVLAALTRLQLAYWKNTETLMNRALEIDPENYVAHSDLGVYLTRQGRTNEAFVQFEEARKFDPELQSGNGASKNNFTK